MNIIVAGCGKIGNTILANLALEGHNVVALDDKPEVIEDITTTYDVMAICGNAVDSDTLLEAGVAETELFVACTASDEMNMLSCFIARRLGAKNTIARIRNPEHNDTSLTFLKQELGLSASINPEMLMAYEIYNILKLPSALKIESFSRRMLELVELRIPKESEMNGLTLIKLRERYKANYLISIVRRGDELHIPHGDFILRDGDIIGLIAAPKEILKLLKSIGVMKKQAKSLIILGGSTTAYYLAKLCVDSGMSVKIIEKNEYRCRHLSALLPGASIIHGDGTKQSLLREEGLRTADAFISLTGSDEENTLISLFASGQGVSKVLAKVNREELASLAAKLGLDCIISPKESISNIIVSYARALENSLGSNVETLYKLMDGAAEALEFKVANDPRIVNIPLKDLRLKKNALIGGILRDNHTIIPSGDDVIKAGDHVVVIAASQRFNDLADILL